MFDLALSSHFLFLYSAFVNGVSPPRHRGDVRVAGEVRMLPVLIIDGRSSPFLHPVVEHFFTAP
jgi:hypothetical protein